MDREVSNQLVIERYKFIQDKIKFLDDILHQNLALVIKILIAVFSIVLGAFLIHFKQPGIMPFNSVCVVIKLASCLIFITSFIFFLMTLSNVLSWFGYRKDEVQLLQEFGGVFQRKKPSPKNFLTWQETWFLISLLLLLIGSAVCWFNNVDFTLQFLKEV